MFFEKSVKKICYFKKMRNEYTKDIFVCINCTVLRAKVYNSKFCLSNTNTERVCVNEDKESFACIICP